MVWEEQQLALTFTQAGGNRDDRGGEKQAYTHIHTHRARGETGRRVGNWRLQQADGLNDNTCNIRGLTHTRGELAVRAFIEKTFYLLLSVRSSPTSIPGLLFHLLPISPCQRVSKPTHISILILPTAKLARTHTSGTPTWAHTNIHTEL